MLSHDFFSNFEYQEVTLPELELEMEDSQIYMRFPGSEEPLELADSGFEHLMRNLAIPRGFANKLRKQGRGHVLSYLQKQLGQARLEPLTLVTNKGSQKIVGLNDKKFMPFTGIVGADLDLRIRELTEKSDLKLFTAAIDEEAGLVEYLFFPNEEHQVVKDLEPLWKWGFRFTHSVIGGADPTFQASWLRMVCANLTYVSEKALAYPFELEGDAPIRIQTVGDLILSPPAPNWDLLNNHIGRARNTAASVREIKVARSLLHGLIDKEVDPEGSERIDTDLAWNEIVDAYRLKELGPAIADNKWLSRAASPHNIFDLYNLITKTATHSPQTVDVGDRQEALVRAGDLLMDKYDITSNPPMVRWTGRRAEIEAQVELDRLPQGIES